MSNQEKKCDTEVIPVDWNEKIYFLTKSQVARITGYKIKTLEELVRSGDFPAPTRLAKHRAPRWNSKSVASAMGVQS